MNTHMLTARLVRAGIDPASVIVRVNGRLRQLTPASHPGLRPINAQQMLLLRRSGISSARFAPFASAVGALERRSPLPPGRYWIDVSGVEKIGKFSQLLALGATLGAVRTEALEIDGAAVDADRVFDVLAGKSDPSAWYLFEVTGVGSFSIDQTTFGAPTIATPDIHHREDTVQRPATPEPGLPTWVVLTLGLGAVFVASQAFANFKGAHR